MITLEKSESQSDYVVVSTYLDFASVHRKMRKLSKTDSEVEVSYRAVADGKVLAYTELGLRNVVIL